MIDAEEHRRLYRLYDRRVDIVSVAEVWFTRARGMSQQVAHFERFPVIDHPDGGPATPDFTVLFNDGTAIIGELSHIAPRTSALDSLVAQISRYHDLTEVPAGPADPATGRAPMTKVTALDVVVFTPVNGMNEAVDELAKILDDPDHEFSPEHPPMLLGYSFDSDNGTYTFQRPTRGRNELVRDHGRPVGLGSWLTGSHDELRGLPTHFTSIKAQSRFMNDEPQPLYTATVLWNFALPDIARNRGVDLPANLDVTASEIAGHLHTAYGYRCPSETATKALEFLAVGRLAERSADGWVTYYRDLKRADSEMSEALLHHHFSDANKKRPLRTATPEPDDDPPAAAADPETLFPS